MTSSPASDEAVSIADTSVTGSLAPEEGFRKMAPRFVGNFRLVSPRSTRRIHYEKNRDLFRLIASFRPLVICSGFAERMHALRRRHGRPHGACFDSDSPAAPDQRERPGDHADRHTFAR